ncbi:RNA polymerase sigma factor [Streptomyces sp. NPDC001401]|uniref:RNA polymerase sigma factor n=1 Tax=Streptomyces sp. NPDC001401 TaxID=3364570 RepID=UPI0036D01483
MSAGAESSEDLGRPPEASACQDPEAILEFLHHTHARAVLRAATLAAGTSSADGLDGMQFAFLQAWRRLNSPTGPAVQDWGGWLRRTAVRHVLKDGESRRQTVQLDGVDLPDPVLDIAGHVVLKEQYQGILESISGLSPRRRQALGLRDIAGYTTAETAEIMGVTEGTVRNLIDQARSHIREAAGEANDD